MEQQKQIIFSGIQPTGEFTLGNYLGAVRNWVALQNDERYSCMYCLADLHAITLPQDPALLRRRTFACAAILLACGLDAEKVLLFLQSDVSAHSELAWILNCNSYMGELSRMTQFKDKAKKQGVTVSVGLFDYPVLMAADILLYGTHLVPVGDDQRQHLELARDIATRFNQRYSETFVVPEGYYGKAGKRIMSLQDPLKKMSKSDENPNAYILLTDDEKTILNKCRRAVTDSDNKIVYDVQNKPGISNLMDIYSCITQKSIAAVEQECAGMLYGAFKTLVAESIIDMLSPIQQRYRQLLNDKAYVNDVLYAGGQKAAVQAVKILSRVKRKVGFYNTKK